MHPLCTESLDGLGLQELASCIGLSDSQLENLRTLGNARHNRDMARPLAAALIFRLIDLAEEGEGSDVETIYAISANASDQVYENSGMFEKITSRVAAATM